MRTADLTALFDKKQHNAQASLLALDADLQQLFIKTLREDQLKLQQGIAEQDIATVKQVAHRIYGATTYTDTPD